MIEGNIEILKWFVAIPSAIIATITIPWVVKKYYLECKKLNLEIKLLQTKNEIDSQKSPQTPGLFFTAFARYWPVFSYGSMALFLFVGIIIKNNYIILLSFLASLVLFVAGSSVQEHYEEIIRKIKN